MRVLQVDSGREWRGGQNQARLLSRELVKRRDIDVRLVTRRGSELARRATAAGVPVTGVPWLLGPDPLAAFQLARLVGAFQPAVVHVHDAHALTVARWALRWAGSTPPPAGARSSSRPATSTSISARAASGPPSTASSRCPRRSVGCS